MSTTCPKCHTDNPEDSKFCKECATPFPGAGGAVLTKTIETPYPQFKPGTSLANRYEIISELGKGGMGEVYLAEDTNLKRQVAVKVLPQPFALDKERLARFEREARLLASLNHPNIATIHGLEKSDNQQFLVMELVEGETLVERLKKGAFSVDESLEICHQIAEGLESAHEKGIIHRDLKPGNIMITPECKVKILDFGLAKIFQEEPEATDLSKSPTLTDQMTRPGVILGTAAYMSPEQARSLAVDKRTDIWAFGSVLYECLSGKRALQGETVSDTLALILKGEPDWTKLPSNTPNVIRVLLRRCLHKDPRKRLHDIADARIEIEEIASHPFEDAAVTKHFQLGWLLTIGVVGILFGLMVGFMILKSKGSRLSSPSITSIIKVQSGHSLGGIRAAGEFNWPSRKAIALSKDGRFLIYSAVNDEAGSDASPQLFLRRLNKQEATPIPGTENGIAPFLSPDDSWVGFFANGKLVKVPIEGGVSQPLTEYRGSCGASWGDDNMIVFSPGLDSGLFWISSIGGTAEKLTEPDPELEEYSHRLPSHFPNGKGLVFTIMDRYKDLEPRLAILDLLTRKWKTILENASDARYIPTGHLVFMRKGKLMGIRFNLENLDVEGQPVPIIPNVMHALNTSDGENNTSSGQYCISETGMLMYAQGSMLPDKKYMLVWVDRNGIEEAISSQTKAYSNPRLSSDGNKIVYNTSGNQKEIWEYEIDRDIHRGISTDGMSANPIWIPDEDKFIFSWHDSNSIRNIYTGSLDGSLSKERLTNSPYIHLPASISTDGNLLAFCGIFRQFGYTYL